jgi:hypothetical protein
VPPAIPETTPDEDPIEAIPGALLLQVPPVGVLDNVVVALAHSTKVPVIAVGNAFTVAIVVLMQPFDAVYVIVAVPKAEPLTTPAALTGAIPVAPELHVPPNGVALSVVVEPMHTPDDPDITGRAFAVAMAVTKHPVPNVYVMTEVPAETPVITPVDGFTVTLVPLLLQVPPAGVLASVLVASTQTPSVPVMAVGIALTETTVVV